MNLVLLRCEHDDIPLALFVDYEDALKYARTVTVGNEDVQVACQFVDAAPLNPENVSIMRFDRLGFTNPKHEPVNYGVVKMLNEGKV